MLAFFAVGTTAVAEQHQKAREPSLFTSEFILASTEAISLSSAQKEIYCRARPRLRCKRRNASYSTIRTSSLGSSQRRRLTKVQLRSR